MKNQSLHGSSLLVQVVNSGQRGGANADGEEAGVADYEQEDVGGEEELAHHPEEAGPPVDGQVRVEVQGEEEEAH